MKIHAILFIAFILSFGACQTSKEPIVISPELFHQSVDKVTEIMIHDIFSPPVASRVFVYPNIAAYEILVQDQSQFQSLSGRLSAFKPIPPASNDVNKDLAALMAHMELSKSLIFSEDKFEVLQDSLYTLWQKTNANEFKASKTYADRVVTHINSWISKDNYAQTRSMPKFTVDIDDPSRWQPTPPAYMDGIEPHWNKIRPLIINSADQFKSSPPPPFSLDKNSKFYNELQEVYDVSRQITKAGDESEEIEIARFWDCNPYVSVTRGHFMFATKKITPGAHWIGITKIASRKSNHNVLETMNAYTKTSIAIFDAFISCWDEKYRSNLVRPETLINQHIDENWKPILQTPPFPEYTSGHSVVSGAASTVLTSIFGDNFSFDDDTELPYGLPIRSFPSFNAAADEAALSRLYGGIHYKAAIDVGLLQGRNLGKFVDAELKK